MGLNVSLVLVGNKGKQYFGRRPQYNVVSEWPAVCRRRRRVVVAPPGARLVLLRTGRAACALLWTAAAAATHAVIPRTPPEATCC